MLSLTHQHYYLTLISESLHTNLMSLLNGIEKVKVLLAQKISLIQMFL